ncbi:MAG: NAD-dependent epimerase/dehydratase family protein [Candidatus Bathyarchaeia archaeon]
MIVVTGGHGFIGSHLVEYLRRLGYDVLTLDKQGNGRAKYDISTPGEWVRYLKEADLVFHLAALADVRACNENPELAFKDNTVTTMMVLEAMKYGKGKLIFTSSSAVYGSSPLPFKEEDLYNPLSIYGTTKVMSEELIKAYGRMFNLPYLIIRLSNVVGAGAKRGIVLDFIKKAREKELLILGDGRQKRDFIHVSDVVKILYGLSEEEGVYNVGSGSVLSAIEVAKIVCDELSLNPKIRTEKEYGSGWEGDPHTVILDVSKMRSLGFNPMSAEEAVRRAVRELMNQSSLLFNNLEY